MRFLLFPFHLIKSLPGYFVITFRTTIIFLLPGLVVGAIAGAIFARDKVVYCALIGAATTLLICFILIAQNFLSMWRRKQFDRPSLQRLPDKFFALAMGLFASFTCIVYAAPRLWPDFVNLFQDQTTLGPFQTLQFSVDHFLRGLLFDVFEVFGWKVSSIEHNTRNYLFCGFLVAFRLLSSALIAATVIAQWQYTYNGEKVIEELLEKQEEKKKKEA